MKNKNCLPNGGFTLMELLLVIAIIGILASVMYAGLGNQRSRARGAAALETVRSAMPYVAECYLKSETVNVPDADGGGSICGLGVNYPEIGSNSTQGCAYTGGGGAGNAAITIHCDAGDITCNYTGTVNCEKSGF